MTGEALQSKISRLQILSGIKLRTLTEVILEQYQLVQLDETRTQSDYTVKSILNLTSTEFDTDYVMVYEATPVGLSELIWSSGDKFIQWSDLSPSDQSRVTERSDIIKQRFQDLMSDRLTSLLKYQSEVANVG